MLDLWLRHSALLSELGWNDIKKTKNHLIIHMTLRQLVTGNAWEHACFEDESLNKLLKKACVHAHQANFEHIVFVKLEHMLQKAQAKRKLA